MDYRRTYIPNGWINCPDKSSLIAGLFIVSKTILDRRYDNEIIFENRFNWKLLNDTVRSTYNRRIGLIINLTFTDRFYNKLDIERDGCRYVKLSCKGHDECPSPSIVEEFNQAISNFIKDYPHHIICIHCTHGFNRSGFMLVSYLIKSLKMDLETSISTFAKARSPGIFKEDYLTELVKRYGHGDEQIKVPEYPQWKINNNNCGTIPGQGKRSTTRIKNTKFMDGMIANVDNISDSRLIREIQSIVMNMCGFTEHKFPGAQPVSLDVDNIDKLTMKNYRVTWKADGQRYMTLIKGDNEVYMMDRDFAVYKVNNLTFPRRNALHQHITNTLLDGEMVIDKYPNFQRGRYLVYDIITFEGQEVSKTPFTNRHKCIHYEIIEPRTKGYEKGLVDKNKETFSVSLKDFWDLTTTRSILDGKFSKQLLHDSDGLIFQPLDDIYQFGHCTEILKWKPPELNTIDFKLNIEKDEGGFPVGQLMVGGLKPSFAKIQITKSLSQFDNKIIECSWDFEKKAWKFMRERTDKSYPNKLETAHSIVRSIKNPVTKETLYKTIDTQRFDLIRKDGKEGASKDQEPKVMKYQPRQSNPFTKISHAVLHPASQVHHTVPQPPTQSTQVNNISQLMMQRLHDTDPFGLCGEVMSLLCKFPIPKEFDIDFIDPVISNFLQRRSSDPVGLMDSDDDTDFVSPEKKQKLNL